MQPKKTTDTSLRTALCKYISKRVEILAICDDAGINTSRLPTTDTGAEALWREVLDEAKRQGSLVRKELIQECVDRAPALAEEPVVRELMHEDGHRPEDNQVQSSEHGRAKAQASDPVSPNPRGQQTSSGSGAFRQSKTEAANGPSFPRLGTYVAWSTIGAALIAMAVALVICLNDDKCRRLEWGFLPYSPDDLRVHISEGGTFQDFENTSGVVDELWLDPIVETGQNNAHPSAVALQILSEGAGGTNTKYLHVDFTRQRWGVNFTLRGGTREHEKLLVDARGGYDLLFDARAPIIEDVGVTDDNIKDQTKFGSIAVGIRVMDKDGEVWGYGREKDAHTPLKAV